MSALTEKHSGSLIVTSLLIALILSVIPLPEALRFARPDWALLVLLYWNLELPDRVGVGTAWLVGLLQDVLVATLLGQHALGYTLAAYIAVKLHQRIRLYPIWQQAISISVLLALSQLISLWINGILGRPVNIWLYWLPTLLGILVWPLVSVTLRNLRRLL